MLLRIPLSILLLVVALAATPSVAVSVRVSHDDAPPLAPPPPPSPRPAPEIDVGAGPLTRGSHRNKSQRFNEMMDMADVTNHHITDLSDKLRSYTQARDRRIIRRIVREVLDDYFRANHAYLVSTVTKEARSALRGKPYDAAPFSYADLVSSGRCESMELGTTASDGNGDGCAHLGTAAECTAKESPVRGAGSGGSPLPACRWVRTGDGGEGACLGKDKVGGERSEKDTAFCKGRFTTEAACDTQSERCTWQSSAEAEAEHDLAQAQQGRLRQSYVNQDGERVNVFEIDSQEVKEAQEDVKQATGMNAAKADEMKLAQEIKMEKAAADNEEAKFEKARAEEKLLASDPKPSDPAAALAAEQRADALKAEVARMKAEMVSDMAALKHRMADMRSKMDAAAASQQRLDTNRAVRKATTALKKAMSKGDQADVEAATRTVALYQKEQRREKEQAARQDADPVNNPEHAVDPVLGHALEDLAAVPKEIKQQEITAAQQAEVAREVKQGVQDQIDGMRKAAMEKKVQQELIGRLSNEAASAKKKEEQAKASVERSLAAKVLVRAKVQQSTLELAKVAANVEKLGKLKQDLEAQVKEAENKRK